MAGASGFSPCKTCLPLDLRQEAVWLVLPSWELLSLLEGAEGICRVQLLVQGGGQGALSQVWYVGYNQSEMLVDVPGAVWGLLEGLVQEAVPA